MESEICLKFMSCSQLPQEQRRGQTGQDQVHIDEDKAQLAPRYPMVIS